MDDLFHFSVWLTIIVTSVSPHRVRNPQAVTELSQSAGYDDGKLGHDDGKQYTLRIPWEDPHLGSFTTSLTLVGSIPDLHCSFHAAGSDVAAIGRPGKPYHLLDS